MSSFYVRQMMEGWLQDAGMVIPYYPTINEGQDPQDAMYCTLKFSSSFRDTITFCQGDTSEEGEVEVIYFGQAGIGYNALIQALEADMITLMAQRDLTGKLTLVRRSAPFEFSGGSAGQMYGLSIYIDYTLYE